MADLRREYETIMRAEGLPEAAVASFAYHFERVRQGDTGTLDRTQIAPVEDLEDLETLSGDRGLMRAGEALLGRTVVVKLNGGLGTSMGLERAKSLLPVRDGLSFLDLIAGQVLSLRQRSGTAVPLLLMNSFRTAEDSQAVLEGYPELAAQAFPLGFLQHKVPKILAEDLSPAVRIADSELAWCPPGHGDIYAALSSSGLLNQLLNNGFEYAFVSNADNLGAVFEERVLGFMAERGAGFLMEVADRTAADRKGGHLCRLTDGRLALRESAQCPADEEGEFQDIERYRYFNTNNVWVHLPALADLLEAHRGVLPLDTIINRKHLNPRNPSSPQVLQLETAMGAALSQFERAVALRVPRRRFSPVKTSSDLLGVRSDAYVMTRDKRVLLHPERSAPPTIELSSSYRLIDDFERRFAAGVPSLVHCESLEIEGDVSFGAGVRAEGKVRLVAERPARVADGTVLSGEVLLH